MCVCVDNAIIQLNFQCQFSRKKIRVLTFPILAQTPPQACMMDLFLSIPYHRRANQDTEANHQVASYRV